MKYKIGNYVSFEKQKGAEFVVESGKIIEFHKQTIHSGEKINYWYLISYSKDNNLLVHEDSIISLEKSPMEKELTNFIKKWNKEKKEIEELKKQGIKETYIATLFPRHYYFPHEFNALKNNW